MTGPITGEASWLAILVQCEFASGTLRTWEGVGELKLPDDTVWLGNGGMVGLSDVNVAAGFFASTLSVSLSGVAERFDDFYTRAMSSEDEVKGRRIIVSWQPFGPDWQPAGPRVALWAGVMDKLVYDRSIGQRSVTLRNETPFVTRRKPRAAFLSPEDQARLFPGDLGLSHVGASASKTLTWPQY